MAIGIVKDCVDFLLGIMYFKMIQRFVTSFKLQTVVHQDGQIDIVGIEANGHEVFKFELSEDQHHKLLGVAKSMIQR